METFNTLAYPVIFALVVALIFSKQIHRGWSAAKNCTSRHAGVKVFKRQILIDTQTLEPFERIITVNGVRLALVSLLMRLS